MKPSTRSMRAARSAEKAAGFSQHLFRLPADTVQKLDRIKSFRKLRNRNATINALIGEVEARVPAGQVPLPRQPVKDVTVRVTPLNLHKARFAYLQSVRSQVRGLQLSVALEAVIDLATLAPDTEAERQLTLDPFIEEESAVSG